MKYSPLLAVIASGFLFACGHAQVSGKPLPLIPAAEQRYEGFFDQSELQPIAKELGINQSIILGSMSAAGLIFVSETYKIDQKKRDQLRAFYCSPQESAPFFGALCGKLNSEACATECTFEEQSFRGTGVRVNGGFLVTARHVGEPLVTAKDAVVKFQEAGGAITEFRLQPTKFSMHTLPHDLSLYRIIDGHSKSSWVPQIRTSPMEIGEPVFGVGFPVLMGRETQNKFYSQNAKGLRVSLGRVTDPNLAGNSFCQFTNEDDVTDIEAWKLEKSCERTDYKALRYKARQEKDPFLTNSDMTFGMSGSPLFDKNGDLVGIGSNVLSNTAQNYDKKKNAVYIKSKWILSILPK